MPKIQLKVTIKTNAQTLWFLGNMVYEYFDKIPCKFVALGWDTRNKRVPQLHLRGDYKDFLLIKDLLVNHFDEFCPNAYKRIKPKPHRLNQCWGIVNDVDGDLFDVELERNGINIQHKGLLRVMSMMVENNVRDDMDII
jgi:hypothetical protein